MKTPIQLLVFATLLPLAARAQINTGSDGHDGAFNPTQNTVIDMADHPDGIYQYTSVNIRAGVSVTFKPNANNTPVVWLLKGSCVINGTVYVSGQNAPSYSEPGVGLGGQGGPGGFRGGNGGPAGNSGQGPGGGAAGGSGEPAAFGTIPSKCNGNYYVPYTNGTSIYGNKYLVPLIGGSGGGGGTNLLGGGGGGGGAILVAAPSIELNGSIAAYGGGGAVVPCYYSVCYPGGGGSGGAVRFVTGRFTGVGAVIAGSGSGPYCVQAGQGRVRIDALDNGFGGQISGVVSQGFQPIILPATGQGAQIAIASVAGNQVTPSPTGQLATPDVIIPAQQANPIPVVVSCANVPLNTPITVTVKPMNGIAISAVGQNSAGTLASSTAAVSLNLPRGGGLIYATATLPLGGLGAATGGGGGKAASYAQTGLTTDGERFAKLEIIAALGGAQQIAYVTESGKRFALPTAGR